MYGDIGAEMWDTFRIWVTEPENFENVVPSNAFLFLVIVMQH